MGVSHKTRALVLFIHLGTYFRKIQSSTDNSQLVLAHDLRWIYIYCLDHSSSFGPVHSCLKFWSEQSPPFSLMFPSKPLDLWWIVLSFPMFFHHGAFGRPAPEPLSATSSPPVAPGRASEASAPGDWFFYRKRMGSYAGKISPPVSEKSTLVNMTPGANNYHEFPLRSAIHLLVDVYIYTYIYICICVCVGCIYSFI